MDLKVNLKAKLKPYEVKKEPQKQKDKILFWCQNCGSEWHIHGDFLSPDLSNVVNCPFCRSRDITNEIDC